MLEILAINWNVDPIMFHIGGFGLRWYSFGFLFAFGVGYWLVSRMYKKEGVSTKYADAFLVYMFLGVLFGARLGHCLFYEPDYYLTAKHWHEMIIPINGKGEFTGYMGLASHGAAIGVLIALWLFYKIKHINAWWAIDRMVIAVALGGAFIRLGNLMNSEIWGYETSLPWGFVFMRDPEAGMVARHPSQLYESLCYIVIFVVSLLVYKKKQGKLHNGRLFGWWLIALFSVRILIEFTKARSVDMGDHFYSFFSMGQWLSVPLILLGATLVVLSHKGVLHEGIYVKGYEHKIIKDKKKQ